MERTGARVLLREFADDDVDALLAVDADPRVMRYYDPEVGTREHARSLVTMFIEWANERPRQNFQLAIIDSGSRHGGGGESPTRLRSWCFILVSPSSLCRPSAV